MGEHLLHTISNKLVSIYAKITFPPWIFLQQLHDPITKPGLDNRSLIIHGLQRQFTALVFQSQTKLHLIHIICAKQDAWVTLPMISIQAPESKCRAQPQIIILHHLFDGSKITTNKLSILAKKKTQFAAEPLNLHTSQTRLDHRPVQLLSHAGAARNSSFSTDLEPSLFLLLLLSFTPSQQHPKQIQEPDINQWGQYLPEL